CAASPQFTLHAGPSAPGVRLADRTLRCAHPVKTLKQKTFSSIPGPKQRLTTPNGPTGGVCAMVCGPPSDRRKDRPEMIPLLSDVLEAHGGLDRWKSHQTLTAT